MHKLEFNVFTDASKGSICIVAYLQIETTLILTYVIVKRCVTPIRHMTIPKLELQAAVYRFRLRMQILIRHDVRIGKIYHWTESSKVLQFLKAADKKQQVSVANRAAKKLQNISLDQ